MIISIIKTAAVLVNIVFVIFCQVTAWTATNRRTRTEFLVLTAVFLLSIVAILLGEGGLW